MYKRHFLALLITIGIYYLPYVGYNVADKYLWLHNALLSVIYIALIYNCAKIRLMPLLIAVETMAVITTFAASFQFDILHSKGFFYGNYEQIINACYITELIIIGVGILNGGAIKTVHRLWLSLFDRDSHSNRSMVSWEKPV